jgi:hypothetical protein
MKLHPRFRTPVIGWYVFLTIAIAARILLP